MEAKLIDFKQALEINLVKVDKKTELKTNSFNDKLKEANKNTKSVDKGSNRDKKEVKKVEENKETEEIKDEVEELEGLEKKDKIVYEGMVNLLNIKAIVVDESPKISLEELSQSVVSLEENLEKPNDLELDEEIINLINLHEDEIKLNEVPKGDLQEELIDKLTTVDNQEVKSLDKQEIKSEVVTQNTNKKEISIEDESLEEEPIVVSSPINTEEVINEETTKHFGEGNKKSETKLSEDYELVLSSDKEVNNESFGPIIKEGIEFTNENLMEVEIPEVEPKEVVKQIVDQVKFDLSENKSEMKLTLKPEALGEMTMNVEVTKDGIIAKVMVDNYKTKEIIDGNILQLKEGIKDTGMEIKTFEVFVGNGSDFDQHNFDQSSQFNLKQNSKKLKIKTTNNQGLKDYEDGIGEGQVQGNSYNIEEGLNLFA